MSQFACRRQPQAKQCISSSSGSESDDAGAITASNINVVVRVRPQNNREKLAGCGVAIRILDDNLLVFDPKEECRPEFYQGQKRKCRDITKKKNRDVRFAFDKVFDVDVENREIYENTCKSILDGLLDGYNCSGNSQNLKLVLVICHASCLHTCTCTFTVLYFLFHT